MRQWAGVSLKVHGPGDLAAGWVVQSGVHRSLLCYDSFRSQRASNEL
ncbi:hypothetical protein GCM10008018_57620 [Paenibacillus marchantiophytorum]|uniref:Uncharacterized protein n=1 Tax=Paenibacillus marchantiophytorum TaxID=1619310 RepID=A0ABQ1FAA3_9BACL|nr:hypothetical protein [Paenibacillus marchantiophytorum]GGA04164.1 hypothetical protein GCM10008018_57620 [Paenibacillus marchantiophytorum]